MMGSPRAIDLFTIAPPSYLYEVINSYPVMLFTATYVEVLPSSKPPMLCNQLGTTKDTWFTNLRRSTENHAVFISKVQLWNRHWIRTATTGNFLPAGILAGVHTFTVKPEKGKST